MKKLWVALISLCVMLSIFSVGFADAADGTLKITFKYKDPTTGVEQFLNNGFIYLHAATKSPPLEKFFSKADSILGPSNTQNGMYSFNVPAGKYFFRILQRKEVAAGSARPYGPPESGDLTWFQTAPITVVASATLDLGTKYAKSFGSSITITGAIKNHAGVPLAGRYVRATTEPCVEYSGCSDDGAYCDQSTNSCGPEKYMALQPTDANGRYKLNLRDPGTYYISSITIMDTTIGCSGYCAPAIIGTGTTPLPISVQMGVNRAADIITN